ncbi:D-alanine--D-alanine ligase family protein [Treponema primitia]|uniref:D-alanine--D-alanine ligase family protein n=1 Tax=Treponema primitia TaxID=88058 RepID=UPI00025550B3|nr:D-alanine--D-alanine ligase family protein [Treponema primitia]
MLIRVGVLFGGKSVEHEVSIISAIQAINGFDKTKYEIIPLYMTKEGALYAGDSTGKIEEYRNIPGLLKKSHRVIFVNDNGKFLLMKYPAKGFGKRMYASVDIVFPIVHGTNVEDGALQGYLKTLSVPFVGCDVAASAAGMEKYTQKAILKYNDIPVLDCVRVFSAAYFKDMDTIINQIEGSISYPLIVKPSNLGSSIGIKKALNRDELKGAFEYTFQYANIALVERAVTNLKEINCAVLGDQDLAIASECEEPINTDDILSYNDKYISGGKNGSKGMSGAKRRLPADIAPETREEIRNLAIKTFQALGCNGVARIDFFIDLQSNKIFVNEINTIPGSLSFYLWEPIGISYTELLTRLINLTFKRERENAGISYCIDTNILANFTSTGAKGAKSLA